MVLAFQPQTGPARTGLVRIAVSCVPDAKAGIRTGLLWADSEIVGCSVSRQPPWTGAFVLLAAADPWSRPTLNLRLLNKIFKYGLVSLLISKTYVNCGILADDAHRVSILTSSAISWSAHPP